MLSYKYNELADVRNLYQNDKVKARFYCTSSEQCKNLQYDNEYKSYTPNTRSIDGKYIEDAVNVLKSAKNIILSADNDKDVTDILTHVVSTLPAVKKYIKCYGGRVQNKQCERSIVQIMIPDETPIHYKKYITGIIWAALAKNENSDADIINSIIDAA